MMADDAPVGDLTHRGANCVGRAGLDEVSRCDNRLLSVLALGWMRCPDMTSSQPKLIQIREF